MRCPILPLTMQSGYLRSSCLYLFSSSIETALSQEFLRATHHVSLNQNHVVQTVTPSIGLIMVAWLWPIGKVCLRHWITQKKKKKKGRLVLCSWGNEDQSGLLDDTVSRAMKIILHNRGAGMGRWMRHHITRGTYREASLLQIYRCQLP